MKSTLLIATLLVASLLVMGCAKKTSSDTEAPTGPINQEGEKISIKGTVCLNNGGSWDAEAEECDLP